MEPRTKDLLSENVPSNKFEVFIEQDDSVHEAAPPRRAKVPWYRQAFQGDYLDLYLHRDLAEAERAVQFLARALALDRSQRLLDLCCGPGRHLVFLGQYVRDAVGLDLSRVLLTRAKEHWEECGAQSAERGEIDFDHPQSATPRSALRAPHLVQSDMRHLPLAAASFDRVVNLFTSFGYFEHEDDNAAVLREIARVLRPGGRLALDHINREAMLAHLKPQTERVLPDGRHLLEKRRFDPATRRVIKDVAATDPGGQVRAWCESVRVYEPDELTAMLAAAGLEPGVRHGDYDGGAWRPESPRLILVAQKN